MFRAKVKSEILKEIIDVISTLVDEIKFTIKEETIEVKAVDVSHIAMLHLKVKREAFEEYEATDVEIGVIIDKMKEILSLSKTGQIVSLTHDEIKNQLVMEVGHLTRRITLLDTSHMKDQKVPSLVLPAKIVLKTSEISYGIKATQLVSEYVTLRANPQGFEMKSTGDSDYVDLKLPLSSIEEIECNEQVESTFSLDYFSKMIKSMNQSQPVTISMGTEFPIRLEFSIAEGNGEGLYLLAPRVEED